MTRRKSKREIEHTIDELENREETPDRDPFRLVYRDPVTGRCYDGWGTDAAPIETLPENADLIVFHRSVSMMRSRAEAEGREIIDVIEEHDRGEVVATRIEPAEEVDTDAAVVVSDTQGPTVDFSNADT